MTSFFFFELKFFDELKAMKINSARCPYINMFKNLNIGNDFTVTITCELWDIPWPYGLVANLAVIERSPFFHCSWLELSCYLPHVMWHLNPIYLWLIPCLPFWIISYFIKACLASIISIVTKTIKPVTLNKLMRRMQYSIVNSNLILKKLYLY